MASFRYLLALVVVLGLAEVTFATAIQPRMSNGAVVDTLRRFPHHVTIEPIYDWYSYNGPRLCGGSILTKNWILTSSHCVRDSWRLNLHFQRLHRNDTSGSYTVVVNNDPSNVYVYPTGFDDIAMVKMPIDLIFSNTIKPIAISEKPLDQLQNKLAVLPGFDFSTVSDPATPYPPNYSSAKDILTYAMLSIVSNSACRSAYKPDVFDEYLNVCAKGWGNNRNTPCGTDFGNGLVVDWPADPKLIGVYSGSSYDCDTSSPSIYINVEKYKSWIDSVIWNN